MSVHPKYALRIGAFLLIALWVAYWRYTMRALSDDALITIRYAMNLAHGHGLVFNHGERILGTSTPLFALILAGFEAIRLPAWMVSQVIDCAANVATCGLTLWLGIRTRHETWAWLAILLFLSNPIAALSIGGMETGLFTFLILATCICIALGHHRAAALLIVPAAMTRIEGFLLIPVLAVWVWKRESLSSLRVWRKYLLLTAIPLIVYLLALTAYFGSPLPHSMLAKLSQTTAAGSRNFIPTTMVKEALRSPFVYYGQLTQVWGLFEYTAIIVAAITWPVVRPALLWGALYLAFMAAGKAPTQYWYHQPLVPVRCMAVAWFACLVATRCWGWLARQLPGRISTPSPLLVAVSALGLILAAGPRRHLITLQAVLNTQATSAGAWDYAHYADAATVVRDKARPNDELGAPEIGYLGVLSGCRIFDVVGLVTPAVFQPEYRNLDWFESTARRKCRFMITRLPQNRFSKIPSRFVTDYDIVKMWPGHDAQTTILFERRAHPQNNLGAPQFGIHPGLSLEKYVPPAGI